MKSSRIVSSLLYRSAPPRLSAVHLSLHITMQNSAINGSAFFDICEPFLDIMHGAASSPFLSFTLSNLFFS